MGDVNLDEPGRRVGRWRQSPNPLPMASKTFLLILATILFLLAGILALPSVAAAPAAVTATLTAFGLAAFSASFLPQ